MCGIAGIYSMVRQKLNQEENLRLLKQMTDCLRHRGPDGEGQVILDDGHVYLGHRRLSIIDLSTLAAQPMKIVDENREYTITYNGEIYNYKELRKELGTLGHCFFSKSDTEVVARAYAEWGTDCFVKFNGMFVFAIWDNYRKELILARDRYGVKPLYYAEVENQLLFASEYKAILEHGCFKRRINEAVLKEYLTFQNILTDDCLLQGIKLLPAGTYMKLIYDRHYVPEPIAYWDYCFEEEDRNISLSEYEEELERLFVQAVNRQMVSDVEIGGYLSGGIDSGSITAVASKKVPYMKSFTCGFDLHSASGIEMSFDEREKAELMSYFFKTEHYEMVLKSGDMERCMPDLVWHIEDPRVGQSYPNYYASKLAAQFVKVVLCGAGGDELFGGYPWRYYRTVNNRSFDEYTDKYYNFWQRLLTNEELENVLTPIANLVKDIDCNNIFRNVFRNINKKDLSPEQCINYSLYFETKTFLHGLLLIEDKISMAHGLETRVPFLDNDLVDFAMRLPVKYKLNNLQNVVQINENSYPSKKSEYYTKTKDGKTILRNVMNRYIPQEVTQAVKQGFSAPDATWFRGESIDYVKSIVMNKNSKIFDMLDYSAVNSIVNRHFAGKENKRLFVWSILNLEEYINRFLA